jgi:hypothetical protein
VDEKIHGHQIDGLSLLFGLGRATHQKFSLASKSPRGDSINLTASFILARAASVLMPIRDTVANSLETAL